MKNTARDYLMNGLYMSEAECYTITYRPYSQQKTKFKYFTDIKEAAKWCKRQRGKIVAYNGSWQILEMLDGVDIFSPNYGQEETA